jgi:hypothetical protein
MHETKESMNRACGEAAERRKEKETIAEHDRKEYERLRTW